MEPDGPAYRLPREGDLLVVLARWSDEDRRSESTIAGLTAGNPRFYERIRSGGSCTVRLYLRVLRWFSDHWPEHLEWPPGVPRPEPAPDEEAAA